MAALDKQASQAAVTYTTLTTNGTLRIQLNSLTEPPDKSLGIETLQPKNVIITSTQQCYDGTAIGRVKAIFLFIENTRIHAEFRTNSMMELHEFLHIFLLVDSLYVCTFVRLYYHISMVEFPKTKSALLPTTLTLLLYYSNSSTTTYYVICTTYLGITYSVLCDIYYVQNAVVAGICSGIFYRNQYFAQK